jgi:bifunctional UDP-N-acetylglucosamine pyrophosphorylase/glucosamine-1-phosphate N-acetyltransferase
MVKSPFSVIVLAAGKGTRMKSPLPKVLHPVAGVPMIQSVIDAVKASGAEEVRCVLGHGEAMVRAVVEPLGAVCFRQHQQLGTADAVRAAQPDSMSGVVLIMNGDHPLIEVADIQKIVNEFLASSAHVSVVSVTLDDPGAYGRIVRHQGKVWAIVEAKDATHESRKIKEVNTGIYVLRAEILADLLPRVQPHNAQGEFYLTDIVALAVEDGSKVETIPAPAHVSQGVNTQAELAHCSRIKFTRKLNQLMENGVTVVDPSATYVEGNVEVGEGSVLFPNVFLRGSTKIGKMVVVEPGAIIMNSEIGDGAQIKAGTYMDQAQVGPQTQAGPYAHLRPGTVLGSECKVGNFVEMKKVKFGDRSKASHLTYLGDATIGTDVNVGCGTITCNYAADHKKYQTTIGNNVFVGSDTQFVAPVKIGDHAVIGSGSTITKDVPAHALAVTRAQQVIKENYNPKKTEPEK